MIARGASGAFVVSDKPRATIERTAERYYVLRMGEREMGGTNRAALERYARAQGFSLARASGEVRP